MGSQKHKVQLSPRLQLGVGRGYSFNNLLKYSGFIFLALSGVLAFRAGYLMISHDPTAINESNPQVLGASDTPSQTESLFTDYEVKKGDTLFSISQQYGVQWTTLATLNNLKPPFDLKAGQIIKVPKQ